MSESRDAEPLPLTQAQLGIWRGQQIAGVDNPVYNAAEALHIEGELDLHQFEAALKSALGEADALHMAFVETDAAVRQQQVREATGEYVYQDFSQASAPDAQALLWMQAQTQKPLCLKSDCLYRNAVIKVADDHYIWYLCIHHIVCDGYGFALIQRRVVDLYNDSLGGDMRGGSRPLGRLSAVIEQDEQYGESEHCQQDQQFWLQALAGNPLPVSLSTSLAPFSKNAIRHSKALSAAQKQSLAQLSEHKHVNWSHALIAAVALCIYRRTGAQHLTLAIPVMGRMNSAAANVPAMVMNIIPLRVWIPAEAAFEALIEQIAIALAESKPHQRYRYEHLRRDLGLVGGGQRLFGAAVNIMPFDRQLRMHGRQATAITINAGPVEDLSFNFIARPDGGLIFTLEANPDRYSPASIVEIQNEFIESLQLQCRRGQSIVPDYDRLSWLQGEPLAASCSPVLRKIQRQAQNRPGATALVSGAVTLNYRSLWQAVEQVSGALCTSQAHAIDEGDVVALVMSPGSDAIVAMLAVLKCDAVFVFIDPQGPIERNRKILADAKPALVIHEALNAQQIDAYAPDRAVSFRALRNQPKSVSREKTASVREDLPAYLIYTSGSTGTPKGVVVGTVALNDFVTSANKRYRIDASDRVLQFAPLQFDACIEEIFLTLCHGAQLFVRESSMLQSMPAFLRSCAELGITVLDLPTAFWHELAFHLDAATEKLPACMRTVIIGGEAVQEKRVAQWRRCVSEDVVLWNTYGPSEATVVATCAKLNAPVPISIGTPLPGRVAAVLSGSGQIVAKGQAGELVLAGRSLAHGYHGLEGLTAESFIQLSLAGKAPMRAYKTGDRVRIDKNDGIEYLGRLDDQIKISGQRISPGEIESALLSLENIESCVVIAHKSSDHSSLCAFVVSDVEVDQQEIKARLRDKLSEVMVPGTIVQLPALPKTANGKIDKKQLQQYQVEATSNVDEAELTAEQAMIVAVWQEVLGLTNVKLDDDFFLIGGQSLQTISVANRLSHELQREVPVTLLFEQPTVRALALRLRGQPAAVPAHRLQDILDADTALAYVPGASADAHIGPWRQVLLTGCTGFVGAHLLADLLQTTDATITCLVRASSHENAVGKIQSALAQQGLDHLTWTSRVEIVLADLEQPDLGLSAHVAEQLANSMDAIIHNAAVTSVLRDYDSLKYANLHSCRALLKIAQARNIAVHFISTIAVGQGLERLQEAPVAFHEGLADGYQQSKWAAEHLLANARAQGARVTVYRLARVVGATSTGFVNEKDLLWRILRASAAMGVYPQLPIHEPWTPVDIISRGIIAIAKEADGGETFNVTPGTLVSLPTLCQWMLEAGISMQSAPMAQWLASLNASDQPEHHALATFFEQRKNSKSHALPLIDNSRFQEALSHQQLRLPDIDQRYFDQCLASAIAQGFIEQPIPVEAV